MLLDLITRRRAQLLARVGWRPREEEPSFEDPAGLPSFLDELAQALRRDAGITDDPPRRRLTHEAARHGEARMLSGADVASIVHDYGAVCDAITAAALDEAAVISVREYQILNHSIDVAIADAVSAFERGRETANAEQVGFLTHELGNAAATASMAFDILRRGKVGVGGPTAELLHRSIRRISDLIDRSKLEVRLRSAAPLQVEPIELGPFLSDLETAARVDAAGRNIRVCADHEPGLMLIADRRLLTSAITNLLSNAVKFTRTGGSVLLLARPEGNEVAIAVADECGGLPDGKVAELFSPFVQRGPDRTGLGLGLPITRRAIEAHGGRIEVLNRPAHGCVFTVRFPATRNTRAT